MDDPVVDEVRRARDEYAKKFGYDLRAMAADLRRKERKRIGQLVSYPPKPARRGKTA